MYLAADLSERYFLLYLFLTASCVCAGGELHFLILVFYLPFTDHYLHSFKTNKPGTIKRLVLLLKTQWRHLHGCIRRQSQFPEREKEKKKEV